MPDKKLTRRELADRWGVSPESVRQLEVRGMPMTSVEDAERWKSEKTMHTAKANETLNDVRMRRETATARKLELEVEIKSGMVIPIDVVAAQIQAVAQQQRTRLYQLLTVDMPDKLAGREPEELREWGEQAADELVNMMAHLKIQTVDKLPRMKPGALKEAEKQDAKKTPKKSASKK